MVENWQKQAETKVFSGRRNVLQKTFRLPNGSLEDFDIFNSKDFVCVLPLTPDNKVILTRQFRPGTEEIFEEPPSGELEPNQDPTEAAEKELLEETGYQGELWFLRTFVPCAYSTQRGYCYVATNCKKVQEPKPDSTEFIEVIKKPLLEFRKSLRSEGRHCLIGYLALDYLGFL